MVETAQVLDDWDARGQQDGVRGSRGVLHVIDVRAVDADQCGPSVDKMFTGGRGQERAGAKIAIGSPVTRPVRVD